MNEETEHPASPTPGTSQTSGKPARKFSALLNMLMNLFIVVGVVGVALLVIKQITANIIPDVPGVTLTDIHSVDDLRVRFNQDYGAPRLILLVSPT